MRVSAIFDAKELLAEIAKIKEYRKMMGLSEDIGNKIPLENDIGEPGDISEVDSTDEYYEEETSDDMLYDESAGDEYLYDESADDELYYDDGSLSEDVGVVDEGF